MTNQIDHQLKTIQSCPCVILVDEPMIDQAKQKEELNFPKSVFRFALTQKERIGASNASLMTSSSPFHSLFKVLCIFPSRYLCAIGLSPIFSFRWISPPQTLGCILKQPDSQRISQSQRQQQIDRAMNGIVTLHDACFQRTLTR